MKRLLTVSLLLLTLIFAGGFRASSTQAAFDTHEPHASEVFLGIDAEGMAWYSCPEVGIINRPAL
jgi:hypothetical protein